MATYAARKLYVFDGFTNMLELLLSPFGNLKGSALVFDGVSVDCASTLRWRCFTTARRWLWAEGGNRCHESAHSKASKHKHDNQHVFVHKLPRFKEVMTHYMHAACQFNTVPPFSLSRSVGKFKRQICHSAARFRARSDHSEMTKSH